MQDSVTSLEKLIADVYEHGWLATRHLVLEQIEALEREMIRLPQAQIPVTHHFSKGIYAREIRIPKGTLLTGMLHKDEHLNIVSSGDMTVVTEKGVQRILGPCTMASLPGSKKFGFAHEDTIWTTIHATDETDIEKLEADLRDQRESVKLAADREDYLVAIAELGYTHEEVLAQSQTVIDITVLPPGYYKFDIDDSPIEGKGIFARADIGVFETIGPARIKGCRTVLGRFTNHSFQPNAKMVRSQGHDIDLIALVDIKDGQEITINYRDSHALNLEIGNPV